MKKGLKKGVRIVSLVLFFLVVFATPKTTYADSNEFGITIDGAFDDWDDKPMTTITSNGDNFNIKKGSLLADTTDVYFYLNMSETGIGYNNLQTANYELVIAGKTYYLTFANTISSGDSVGTSKEISVSAWSSSDNQNYSLPNAKIIETRRAVGDGYSDTVEFSIPYGDLGLDNTIVNEISLTIKNTNLGEQTISTTGGSTGPYIIAGVGFVMAVGVLFITKRRKIKEASLSE
ncbi:MAG: Firmicu-CTERM sorting domain-containing protein [Enterococcus sp.]